MVADDCLQRFTSNSRQFDHNPSKQAFDYRTFFFSPSSVSFLFVNSQRVKKKKGRYIREREVLVKTLF